MLISINIIYKNLILSDDIFLFLNISFRSVSQYENHFYLHR